MLPPGRGFQVSFVPVWREHAGNIYNILTYTFHHIYISLYVLNLIYSFDKYLLGLIIFNDYRNRKNWKHF